MRKISKSIEEVFSELGFIKEDSLKETKQKLASFEQKNTTIGILYRWRKYSIIN